MIDNTEDEDEEAFEDNLLDPPLRTQPNVQQNNYTSPIGFAPTMTVKVVRIGRPLKVLSVLLAVVAFVLLLIASASTDWIHTDSARIGIFQECSLPISEGSNMPCRLRKDFTGAYLACGLFAVAAMLLLLVGILLFLVAILLLNVGHKLRLYRATLGLYTLSALSFLVDVIFFPVLVLVMDADHSVSDNDYNVRMNGAKPAWSIFVSCGGILLTIVATILLALDQRSEDFVYKEKIVKAHGFEFQKG